MSKAEKKKQAGIELLSPVGGKNQLRAAVENGADAVYLGGRLFNARIKADNFDDEDFLWALDYAHLRNVKVYAALNTLIMDQELSTSYKYAKFLYEAGVDAIILQDIGLAQLVRQGMPDLEMHLSTQGTVYNASGAKLAEELGFSRIVLARELNIQEIKKITKDCLAEIEVFVHGALCICYSGQCQMSRFRGGRSGNRGLCAQPCRLRYNGEYCLSPKDLCTIDYLGGLVEAGVKSLKIEGRMKSPEYVAIVTSIYRKYLDRYLSEGHYSVEPQDRWALAQIYNRDGFTQGYLFGNPGAKLITKDLPKHQGVYLGRVKQPYKNNLIDILLESDSELKIGDGIEVHNRSLPGNIVTFIEKKETGVIRIGDIKGKVSPGDKVYKISDKELNKSARNTYEPLPDGSEKNLRKAPVNMTFTARSGERIRVTVSDAATKPEDFNQDPGVIHVDSTEKCEPALHRPIKAEDILRQLKKTGSVPFNIQNVNINIDENISVPLSTINALRRKALSEFSALKIQKSRRKVPAGNDEEVMKRLAETLAEAADEIPLPPNRRNKASYIPIFDFMKLSEEERLKEGSGTNSLMPYIYNISKGRLDEYLEEHFDDIVNACKTTGIAIGNLGWIKEFLRAGIKVYGDYGLNICNHISEQTFTNIGVSDPNWSLELIQGRDAGDIPLMVTEHTIQTKTLVDEAGKEYPVIRTGLGDKSIVLSGKNPIRRF